MATQNDFSRSFVPNLAMSAFRFVGVTTTGAVAYSAIDTRPIGILQNDVGVNSYEMAVVRLMGTGTCRVSATGVPLTAGDILYVVTNGQVANTNRTSGVGAVTIGIALETLTTGNGSIIEILPFTT